VPLCVFVFESELYFRQNFCIYCSHSKTHWICCTYWKQLDWRGL